MLVGFVGDPDRVKGVNLCAQVDMNTRARVSHASNLRVAGGACAAAGIIAYVWCSWGLRVHNATMENANAYERRLANRLGMSEQAKLELAAFKPCNMPSTKETDV